METDLQNVDSQTIDLDSSLWDRLESIRDFSIKIVDPLTAEDCVVQSMPDASPTRWHLAHTTWFFETFVLKRFSDYQEFDPRFEFLLNSYYNSVGEQFPRSQRGLITRPGLPEVLGYRRYVEEHLKQLWSEGRLDAGFRKVIEIGIQHEQQHQELMLTDIKHAFSCNPLFPRYGEDRLRPSSESECDWLSIEEGLYTAGYSGDQFAFDNEMPAHRTFLHPFSIARYPVTCGEYLEFMEAGGYSKSEYWLSLGWSCCQNEQWDAPLYWVKENGEWMMFTLAGLIPVDLNAPVCHLSYFEADAYARWSGYRLPTEFEWEIAANQQIAAEGADSQNRQFADCLIQQELAIHPVLRPDRTPDQSADHSATENSNIVPSAFLGCVWEWTSSSYAAYPGYTPPSGALGEYNGKFMCNQYVLRGGSVATSSSHIRTTYRNFFPPGARWQFSGIRLAK